MNRLPTKESLAEIDAYAIVLYATRCVRRIVPLFPCEHPASASLNRLVESIVKFSKAGATALKKRDMFDASDLELHLTSSVDHVRMIINTVLQLDALAVAAVAYLGELTLIYGAGASKVTLQQLRERLLEVTELAHSVSVLAHEAIAQLHQHEHTDLDLLAKQHADLFADACNDDVHFASQLPRAPIPGAGIGADCLAGRPLWPGAAPEWWDDARSADIPSIETGPPVLSVVWDPSSVSPDEYAELIAAIGDLVRQEGGIGIERVRSRGFGITCDAGVLQ